MKNILILLTLFLFASCEEVVNPNLETDSPKLVIEASIDWEKGTSGNTQTIKLTTTTGYYDTVIPKVSGAVVTVTNSTNTIFSFVEIPSTGEYVCSNFVPILNETYTLKIVYAGQTYVAIEKMLPTPNILDVEQVNNIGINNDEIGIKINFIDYANQQNFYLFRYDSDLNPFPEYEIRNDQFSDGNPMVWLYSHKNLVQGKKIYFTQYGISENYYNYMRLILGASSGANNGPFQVIPTKVRGNIINQTNEDNFAFGYFRLCETTKSNYTIQ